MKKLESQLSDKLEKLFNSKVFLVLCALLISFFWAGQCSVSLIHRGEAAKDSSVFRYVAYAMSKGLVPYKDIFDHKGPLLYLINYLGYLINEEIGVWLFEYIAILITTFFIFAISKRTCKHNLLAALTTFVSLALVSVYFEGGNLAEEYAMPLIAVSLYIFFVYFQDGKATKLNLLLCGMCGGGVLMPRPNMAVVWLVFPIFVIINEVYKKDIKALLEKCIIFLAGVIIVIIPFAIYFVCTNSLQDFFDVYLIFNAEYSGSDGSLFAILKSIYTYLTPLYVTSVVVVLANIYKRDNLLFNIAYLLFLLLSIIATSMSGRQYGHYGMVLIPVLAYPLATLLAGFKKEYFSEVILCSVFFIICMSYYFQPIYSLSVNLLGLNGGTSETTDEVVDYVDSYTGEEDRILVVGNQDTLYLKCDRLCISKYSYQLPIANVRTEIYDELYLEMEQSNPAVIIVPDGNEDFYGLEEYIYENQYTVVLENDDYTVYQQLTDG